MMPKSFLSRTVVVMSASFVMFTAPFVWAETPQEKGLAIAVEMDKRHMGWGDSQSKVLMTLRTASGDTTTREMRMQSFEINEEGSGDMSLTVFDSPPDVKGTALLSHTRILDPDKQWLYLPALKRVKRMSSANKSGPFVGSEFAYEDLLSPEVAKYSYTFLRDEPCGELSCFVVERVPLYEDSGYTRQLTWIDHDAYRVWKIDYFDRRDSPLKTLTFSDFRLYLDKYWRAHKLEMVNHQNGKSTDFSYDTIEFKTGLDRDDFESEKLKRLR